MRGLRLAILLALTVPLVSSASDETCDEAPDSLGACSIARVTVDLDSPMPTATFWGGFASTPPCSSV